MPDLTGTIETVAGEPQSASSDGQSASHHSLRDLIEADRYLRGTASATTARTGWALLRVSRFVPPSAGPE
jgi:hypothetical protein